MQRYVEKQEGMRTMELIGQRLFTGRVAALQVDQAQYSGLKATSGLKKQQSIQVRSAMNAAGAAWSTKQAADKKLASRREASSAPTAAWCRPSVLQGPPPARCSSARWQMNTTMPTQAT